MARRRPLRILLGGLVLLAASRSFAQGAEKYPIPEYFGIYAVTDGGLVKLDAQQVKFTRTVAARIGQRSGVGNILNGEPVARSSVQQVPELSSDLKIIVYQQSSGMASSLAIAQSLRLEALVFVRTVFVDTGWPQNVRRSGPENGWEAGDAPELLGIASGDRARALEFLVKPVPGQQDMVLAGLAERLKPGLYRLGVREQLPFVSSGNIFAVSPVAEGEAAACVDAHVTYAMAMSTTKYTPCGSARPAADATGGVPRSTPSPGTPVAPSSDPATAGFQFLAAGQLTEATAAWDRALKAGSSLRFSACREKAFGCGKGMLQVNTTLISFSDSKGRLVFSAAPRDFELAAVDPSYAFTTKAASARVRATKKNYSLFYLPTGVPCDESSVVPVCDERGYAQQMAVAGYVVSVIRRAASGDLKVEASPTEAPKELGPPSCSSARDLNYSVLHGGRLYRGKSVGAAGQEVTVFFDDKGHLVTDSAVAQQLTAVAWTRENVVQPADARTGSKRVLAILETSRALQGYQTTQDVLVRANVEALLAGATGGASLTKVVPNLTWGILKSQLIDTKIWLNGFAWSGLQQSHESYKELEAALPPADATALDGQAALHIRDLYNGGRILELSCGGLAVALMPTQGKQLWMQSWKSAVSQVAPQLPPSTQKVTLDGLLKMHTLLSAATSGIEGMEKYKTGFDLAMHLKEATDKKISEAASASIGACKE